MRPSIWVVAMLVLTACSAPGTPSSPSTATLPSTLPSTPPIPSPTVPPPSPTPVGSSDPIEAAFRLLASPGARVSLLVDRAKGEANPEVLISATGVVDPAGDRGHMTYDYSALFAVPGSEATSPDPFEGIEVRWDAGDLYASAQQGDVAFDWSKMAREEALVRGGIIGRMPEEIRGLLVLIADAAPESFEHLSDATLADAVAERFELHVPVADAVAEGVPAEAPNVEAMGSAYDIDAIAIEVWVVNGDLRRIRYALERERAPYGGPDRTSVTYDWTNLGRPADIEILPPRIEVR